MIVSHRSRREAAQYECTRDPIWLLQVRGDKRSAWRTETVFASREEGEAWAKAREYRWRHWMIYAVPAEGELAEFLKEYDAFAKKKLAGHIEKEAAK